MTTTLALSANWTTAPVTLTNSGNAAVFNAGDYSINSSPTFGWCYHDYWYPYYRPIVVEHQDHRPIRLTMSEVERLRVAAKKDKDLKKTLEKFTDHIEVIVDF
jgi:hypothetical protein